MFAPYSDKYGCFFMDRTCLTQILINLLPDAIVAYYLN